MKPSITHAQINGQSEALINASAIVELARSEDNPRTRRFLASYHEAEARIAARQPSLPEHAIRTEAILQAFRSLGVQIVSIAP